MNDERYISVRTRWSTTNHKALRDLPDLTLCRYFVTVARVGGSWFPEHPRRWDSANECNRCERKAGIGNV